MRAKSGNAWLFWVFIAVAVVVLVVFYRTWRPSGREGSTVVGVTPSRMGGRALYPSGDAFGAIDSRVIQNNIHETICVKGYTSRVRPPSSITGRMKRELLLENGLPGTISDYELDHFIPLELGGCPDCRANLWMEPWSSPGAHEKDVVENYLHREVCSDHISLADAQKLIVRDWYAVYKKLQGEETK